jgi:hypothetical protein
MQGHNKVIPYYQKFHKNHFIYLQFESDSPDTITLESFEGTRSIDVWVNPISSSYGTTNIRYYTNFVVTLYADYHDRKFYFKATQGSNVLTSEPVHCYDLTPELTKGTVKYIKYTNLDRNESDLDDRFIDWSALTSEGNYMDFFVDAIDIDPNDTDENEVLEGSQSRTILSSVYYSGRVLKTNGIPDYLAARLGMASSLDVFIVNGLQYIKSGEISQDRFGGSTLYQVSLKLTQKNAIGINTDKIGLIAGSVVSQTNVSTYGESDGSVIVTATGGTAPYQYNIGSGYQSSGTFNGLIAGSYTIVAKDSNGITCNIPVIITEPAAVPETASVTPSSLSWAYNETDTKTVVVNTNMARWYIGSGSSYPAFDIAVYDSTNTTEVTDGIYTDGMVVRVTPTGANSGSSNNVCTLNIANSSDSTLCVLTGVQTSNIYLSINYTSCRFHNNGTPYDANTFTVTHSDAYTLAWTNGSRFSYSQAGDDITVTVVASPPGTSNTDVLTITMGSLTVTFGVIHFDAPN